MDEGQTNDPVAQEALDALRRYLSDSIALAKPRAWVTGASALATAVLSSAALAQADDEALDEIVVEGSLNSLPTQDVGSVFGFDKNLLETPRSASTVSAEQLARFDIRDIDELVALAPGTFTQSFFGVAGSLDVRGTPGETYSTTRATIRRRLAPPIVSISSAARPHRFMARPRSAAISTSYRNRHAPMAANI